MKNPIIAVLLVTTVLVAAGCQKPTPDSPARESTSATPQSAPSFDDVKAKSKEAMKAIGGFTAGKLEGLKKDLLLKLDDMEKKVADLQGEASKQEPSVQEQVHAKLNALSAKLKEAREKLAESAVNATTAEAWEKAKATTDTLIGDLGKAYKDVIESMKQPPKDAKQ